MWVLPQNWEQLEVLSQNNDIDIFYNSLSQQVAFNPKVDEQEFIQFKKNGEIRGSTICNNDIYLNGLSMTDIYLFKIENIFESNRQNFRINLYNKLKNKKKISMKDANDHQTNELTNDNKERSVEKINLINHVNQILLSEINNIINDEKQPKQLAASSKSKQKNAKQQNQQSNNIIKQIVLNPLKMEDEFTFDYNMSANIKQFVSEFYIDNEKIIQQYNMNTNYNCKSLLIEFMQRTHKKQIQLLFRSQDTTQTQGFFCDLMIDGNAVITSYGIKKDIAKTRVCNIALKLFCPKLYDLLQQKEILTNFKDSKQSNQYEEWNNSSSFEQYKQSQAKKNEMMMSAIHAAQHQYICGPNIEILIRQFFDGDETEQDYFKMGHKHNSKSLFQEFLSIKYKLKAEFKYREQRDIQKNIITGFFCDLVIMNQLAITSFGLNKDSAKSQACNIGLILFAPSLAEYLQIINLQELSESYDSNIQILGSDLSFSFELQNHFKIAEEQQQLIEEQQIKQTQLNQEQLGIQVLFNFKISIYLKFVFTTIFSSTFSIW